MKIFFKELVMMKYFWHVLVCFTLVTFVFIAGYKAGYKSGVSDTFPVAYKQGQASIVCDGKTHNPGEL